MSEPLRMIVRFYRDSHQREVIERGLTLDEARAHCSDPTNRGDGWFDGYDIDDEAEHEDHQ